MLTFFEQLRDPAWVGVGSLGTLAAVIVALGSILVDRQQRRSEAQRAQARAVSGWIARTRAYRPPTELSGAVRGLTVGNLLNASDEPVYRVITWLVAYPGDPSTGEEAARSTDRPPAALLVLPPGLYEVVLPEFIEGMHRRPLLEIAFTDAGGVHWVRRHDGQLDRLHEAPVEHYGLTEPFGWDDLRRPA